MHPIYDNHVLDTSKGEIRLLTIHPADEGNPNGIIEMSMGCYHLANSCPQYIEFEKTGQRKTITADASKSATTSKGIKGWIKSHRQSKSDNPCLGRAAKPHSPALFHYVALSYSWGDDTKEKNAARWKQREERDKQKVLINGHIFRVRRNLHAALLQFRTMEQFKKGVKIWIDAVTINQDDEDEVNPQIHIMHQIYQRAGNVVVWLGPYSEIEFDYWGKSEKCSDCLSAMEEEKREVLRVVRVLEEISQYYPTEDFEALDHLRDLAKVQQHREVVAFKLRNVLTQWKEMMIENPDFFVGNMYTAIWKFFEREYWRRLWIIQELSMGNAQMPLICGDRVTHWYQIRNAAILLHAAMDIVGPMTSFELGEEETVESVPHTASHVAGIAQLEFLSHRKQLPDVNKNLLAFTSTPGIGGGEAVRGSTLDQVLALANQTNCRNDKDRIRGLLHVHGIPSSVRQYGVINYKEMTVQQVYYTFAKNLLTQGRLEIFALLDGCDDALSLPSWVPNFARPASRRANPIHGPWFADGINRFEGPINPFLHAPDALPTFIDLESGKEAMLLKGVTIVDVIDGVGSMQPALTKRIASRGSAFQTGVTQPTRPKTKVNPLYEYENVVKRCIYRTLTCGTDASGRKKDFKRLLSSFAPEAPKPPHPHFWNWDFFDATASLVFHGKPLREWMDPYVMPEDIEYDMEDEEREDWGEVSAAMAAMQAKVRGRRLFVTAERGYLGLGPMLTSPGFLLATVYGCARPVILMPVRDRGFRILGECYVDDIMEGEVETMDIPEENIGAMPIV